MIDVAEVFGIRSMLKLFCLAVLVFCAYPASADPVTPTQLYRAEAVVTGVFEPERTRGVREALRSVIVKLTGEHELYGDARVDELAVHANSLVVSFEYEDRMKDIPVHDEQGTRDRPHFLRVRFKSVALDKWLAENHLQKWHPPRPRVRVELSVITARGAYTVRRTGSDGYAQREVIKENSVRRGIPVQLPTKTSNGEDKKAPKLAGTLTLTDRGLWDIDWAFSHNNRVARFALRSVTFDYAIRFGFNQISSILRH